MSKHGPAVVLMLEGSRGDIIGIRFSSRDLARKWEDVHPAAEVRGCIDLVTQARAILDYGVSV